MAGRIEKWGNDLYTGRKNYKIVSHRRILYVVSLALVALAVASMLIFKFNLGIDFRGGSEFKVSNVQNLSQQLAIDAVHSVDASKEPLVSSIGGNSIRVQIDAISDNEQVEKVKDALAKAYEVNTESVTNTLVGPSWGSSVSTKAMQGLIVFLIVVSLFMAVYFRNWKMSLAGILALFHDLIITVGIYAASGWEITPASMIGFLTILGYSMYDTVVVFDKVRENTKGYLEQSRSTFAELANLALNQTLVRSINTSFVALIPVGSVLAVGIFLLGPGTLRDIALALFVGTLIGAYSSIFLATPMAVSLTSMSKKDKEHTALVYKKRASGNSAAVGGQQADSAAIAAKASADARLGGETNADDQQLQTPVVQLLPGKHLGNRTVNKKRKKPKNKK